MNIGEQAVKVAQNLPAGYLSCELTGPGRAVLQHIATVISVYWLLITGPIMITDRWVYSQHYQSVTIFHNSVILTLTIILTLTLTLTLVLNLVFLPVGDRNRFGLLPSSSVIVMFFIIANCCCCMLVVMWCIQSVSSDVKWVDGGRPLFKFGLSLLSTIYTKVFFISVFWSLFLVAKSSVTEWLKQSRPRLVYTEMCISHWWYQEGHVAITAILLQYSKNV